MASRGIRVMLWATLVAAAVLTAYFFWTDESLTRREATAAHSFRESANAASRALMDLRAAQQAYVATGQGDDFWVSKAAAALANTRKALEAMRSASSPEAQSAVRSAASTLDDFEQMDRRVREYVHGGQVLMASDIIFSDGLEMTETVWTDVQRARLAEQEHRDRVVMAARQRQWITLGAGSLALCALPLLLVPVPRVRRERPEAVTSVVEVRPAEEDLRLRGPTGGEDARSAETPTAAPAFTLNAAAPADVDLSAIGMLCTDLARVADIHALPTILERAAGVLDAAGIILWIADPDARELAPILAHGYSSHLVTRLGTIPRDAENVTAAAFRTGLLQTVKADDASNGAIAAPLVSATGCAGVMAVEVRHRGEQQHARLAAATVIAAQLATLVGPPVSRAGKAEMAGG